MYVGNYYGTPKAYVEEQLCAGKDVILEIENPGRIESQRKISEYIITVRNTSERRRTQKSVWKDGGLRHRKSSMGV